MAQSNRGGESYLFQRRKTPLISKVVLLRTFKIEMSGLQKHLPYNSFVLFIFVFYLQDESE